MKYLIIPYIGLGLVLSIAIGIEYHCTGPEMFPAYYGSPFIFKQECLASSMEYYYSLSGLVLNIAVWSILLSFTRSAIRALVEKTGNKKTIRMIYRGVVGALILFATMNIAMDSVMMGRGFKKGLNYWYMDLDKEAKDWGMECEGEWILFVK